MIALTPTETLGARLRRFRQARGWSQRTLSIQSGCHTCLIRAWEYDRWHPHPYNLQRLAAAFGCDLIDLLC
jgi:transcriptional regulator with XRE-family HTH domain